MLVLGSSDQREHVDQLTVEIIVVRKHGDLVADRLGDDPGPENLPGRLPRVATVGGASEQGVAGESHRVLESLLVLVPTRRRDN
jgi:hypothetical protein